MDGKLLRQLREEKEWTLEELSHKSGIPASTIGRLERNGGLIQKVEYLKAFEKLLKNELNHIQEPEMVYEATRERKQRGGIPVYDGTETGEPAYFVDIPQFRDCDFGKIFHGNEMQPAIQSGECIFLQKVTDKSLIIPNEIYMVRFDNFERVRRLLKLDDDGGLMAIADNKEANSEGTPKYPNFSIPLQKITELYQVKGLLKQNLN